MIIFDKIKDEDYYMGTIKHALLAPLKLREGE
jgi:hypothetical protein